MYFGKLSIMAAASAFLCAAPLMAAPVAVSQQARTAAAQLYGKLAEQNETSRVRLSGVPTGTARARMRLQDPMPIAMVRLDQLRAFNARGRADELMEDLGSVIYHVAVDSAVQSEVEMNRQGEGWQITRVGAAMHARHIAARGRWLRDQGMEPLFLLRVPALMVEFVAYRHAGQLQLLPVFALEAAGLEPAMPLPADEALRRLVPLAQAHNGDPG